MNISFEFFPPKNSILQKNLWNTIKKLAILDPMFFSVTCGANGSSKSNTFETVKLIQEKTKIRTAAHLTCINSNKLKLEQLATDYWNNNIKSVIALRGDVVDKENKSEMYAADLVSLLKNIADFDITVAAYPEMHPEAKSAQSDLIYLKKKIDNGANRAITQFFFEIDKYLRFRDRCIAIGINVEIIPGILPVLNFKLLQKFSKMTNVYIPKKMVEIFYGLNDDLNTQKIVGANMAMDMVKHLYSEGVKSFHFYTLNSSDVVYSICHMLKFQKSII